ncbi:MAG: sporulation protein YqfD [Clostridium baratii]|uniref:sporulation protein YqfD n=1 Tax=Clostridium baratii TaxID=1561 RepID=UPI0006C56D7C|nr:sporulation protein YqfD [Clostridium baratii]MBS6006450.1 sporulation protein YqfD [Clostridium baratii]MDU1053880.1 sporulation protein YqfD [Clostridium baratii]CUO90366.1 stage IV sporulation YqfD [Clostridium baratii]
MNFDYRKLSVITLEISGMNTEQILNSLWKNNISLDNIRKVNAVTINVDIYGEDYEEAKKIIKRAKGKVKIVNRRGHIVKISRVKKRMSFLIGGIVFLCIVFSLSTRIWAIDIQTEKNVSPYDIRKYLNEFGIRQGLKKSEINVYDLEKKLEDSSPEILWVRARMEGSSLKVIVEEKVNPPELLSHKSGEIVALKDGEVKRIFTEFGTPAVIPGQIVKKGDTLIYPYEGTGEQSFEVNPSGSVIANVFYERSLDVKVSGKAMERTGEKVSDMYLNLFGKKIYLKKATNSFSNYDKIENKDGILQSNTYYETEEKDINLNKDEVVKESLKKLEEFLIKDLTNEAKIVGREYDVQDIGDGKIKIIAQFAVEEDISS